MIDIRLNDKCPVCGSEFVNVKADVWQCRVVAIKAKCYACKSKFKFVEADLARDKSVVQHWNELSGRKND